MNKHIPLFKIEYKSHVHLIALISDDFKLFGIYTDLYKLETNNKLLCYKHYNIGHKISGLLTISAS